MTSMIERHAAAAKYLPSAKLIIGGRDITTTSAGDVPHLNPATGKEQGRVALGGREEVDAAVRAAREASPAWRALTPSRRRDLIQLLADSVLADGEALSMIAALEIGATRHAVLHSQIPVAHEWMRYYAGWADKLDGRYSSGADGGPFDVVLPEPHGVVAVILPWNGPLNSLAMKAAPALAAGNTLIIKPPESAPYLAIRFGELAREVGFPDGVVNVVIGGPAAGDALVRHPGVDKISFTGSPMTGRQIAAAASETLTPMVFELGGKSANIVFPDFDLERAAEQAATFPFVNAGQICISPSRLLVHAAAYDEVLERVGALARGHRVGDPLDETTFMGPMFSRAARDRVIDHVERAAERPGVSVSAGGHKGEAELDGGWFVHPTIVADPDPGSDLSQTELFGPVVAVHRFEDEEDAIRIANGTEYGLAAYINTQDIDRALRMARRVRAGAVYINGSFPTANPNLPFGGVGASGYGREGGAHGVEEFVRPKSISISVREA